MRISILLPYMLFYVRNKINKAVASGRLFKNVCLSLDAYEGTDTLNAPSKPVPQNLIDAGDRVAFCPILRCYRHYIYEVCPENDVYKRALDQWIKTGISVEMIEYYNVTRFEDLPYLFNDKLCNDVRYYKKLGVSSMMYMHIPMVCWGVRGLTQYLYANICRNVCCDEKAILSKYFKDVFGKYADTVQRVYESVEKASELCASWRAWYDRNILMHLNMWDGKRPEKEFYIQSHIGKDAVKLGEQTAKIFYAASDTLRQIKREELKGIAGTDICEIRLIVNPRQSSLNPPVCAFVDKLNEDIRGLIYAGDVYTLTTLFVKYYNALYAGDAVAKDIFGKIECLCEKMSEYTYSIWFAPYKAELAVKDALTLSHMKELYYRCLSHFNENKEDLV